MSEHSQEPIASWSVCVSEGVHQECGKHISNEQFNASLMCSHILGQGVPQETH